MAICFFSKYGIGDGLKGPGGIIFISSGGTHSETVASISGRCLVYNLLVFCGTFQHLVIRLSTYGNCFVIDHLPPSMEAIFITAPTNSSQNSKAPTDLTALGTSGFGYNY